MVIGMSIKIISWDENSELSVFAQRPNMKSLKIFYSFYIGSSHLTTSAHSAKTLSIGDLLMRVQAGMIKSLDGWSIGRGQVFKSNQK